MDGLQYGYILYTGIAGKIFCALLILCKFSVAVCLPENNCKLQSGQSFINHIRRLM